MSWIEADALSPQDATDATPCTDCSRGWSVQSRTYGFALAQRSDTADLEQVLVDDVSV